MSTTKSLNSENSFWVTTFYGGEANGRCYTISGVRDGKRFIRTVTENELLQFIVDGGVPPVLDTPNSHPVFS